MKPDAASLENLRDIVQPGPVSWWPLAPGWWILMVLLWTSVFFVSLFIWRRWKANAYRREALRELRKAGTVAEIAAILKRSALCAYPRPTVASLSGEPWCRWLQQSSGLVMSESVSEALTEGQFAQQRDNGITACREFAVAWVQMHTLDGKAVSSSC